VSVIWVGHGGLKIGAVKAICDFLDKQPALVERVRRDLVRGLKQSGKGRRGPTAPQVLRALVLMRVMICQWLWGTWGSVGRRVRSARFYSPRGSGLPRL